MVALTMPVPDRKRPSPYGINGRPLLQPVTGTQRVLHENLFALDEHLVAHPELPSPTLFVPRTTTPPAFRRIRVRTSRLRIPSHLWEQLVLPVLTYGLPLLSVGGGAPVLKRRQIVCLHDAGVWDEASSYSSVFRIACRILYRGLTTVAARIIVPSDFSRERLRRRLGARFDRKAIVVRWGADALDRVRADEVAELARSNEPFLLMVGSLVPYKMPRETVANLCDELPEGYRLVVAGASKERLVGPMTSLPAGDNVLLLGRVTDGQLKWLYEHADAFVFPSRYEGYGLPVAEALRQGRIALVGPCPAFDEFADPRVVPLDMVPSLRLGLPKPELSPPRLPVWSDVAADLDAMARELTRRPGVRVLASPGRADPGYNPYNDLLTEHLAAQNVEVVDFAWRRAFLRRYDVFHVHWPDALVLTKTLAGRYAYVKAAVVLLILARLKLAGTRVVWTMHNLRPHESSSLPVRTFVRLWPRLVDATLHLSPVTVVHLPPAGRLDAKPRFVVGHGHYRPWIARLGQDAEVPATAGNPRLLFFGNIRGYKGVPELLQAFRSWSVRSAALTIAGQPVDREMRSRIIDLAANDDRVTIRLERSPDELLLSLLHNSDAVVLPFTDITNSGSVLFALSAGVPVIAPRQGALTYLAAEVGSDWLFLYDGRFSTEVLAAAHEWIGRPRHSAPNLQAEEWTEVTRRTIAAYLSILGRDHLAVHSPLATVS